MGKFLYKLLLLSALLYICDRVVGGCIYNAQMSITKGAIGKLNHIIDDCRDDILVFGSSRAEYHYNPRILEDSLGLSCYNCGFSGYGIINSYGLLKLHLEGHTPKYVILDITPSLDIESSDNHRYLKLLRKRYSKNYIKDVFEKVDPYEYYKMLSYFYRLNDSYTLIPQHFDLTLFISS